MSVECLARAGLPSLEGRLTRKANGGNNHHWDLISGRVCAFIHARVTGVAVFTWWSLGQRRPARLSSFVLSASCAISGPILSSGLSSAPPVLRPRSVLPRTSPPPALSLVRSLVPLDSSMGPAGWLARFWALHPPGTLNGDPPGHLSTSGVRPAIVTCAPL